MSVRREADVRSCGDRRRLQADQVASATTRPATRTARVLAAGGVLVDEGLAPSSGRYEIENRVIVCAHQYFTPPDTLVQSGIVG